MKDGRRAMTRTLPHHHKTQFTHNTDLKSVAHPLENPYPPFDNWGTKKGYIHTKLLFTVAAVGLRYWRKYRYLLAIYRYQCMTSNLNKQLNYNANHGLHPSGKNFFF